MQCTLVRRYALSNDQSKQQDHIKDSISFEVNSLIVKFVSPAELIMTPLDMGLNTKNTGIRKLISNKSLICLYTGTAYDRRPTRHEMMAQMVVVHMLNLSPAPAREDTWSLTPLSGLIVLTGGGRRQVQHVHHRHCRHHFVPRRSPVVGCIGR